MALLDGFAFKSSVARGVGAVGLASLLLAFGCIVRNETQTAEAPVSAAGDSAPSENKATSTAPPATLPQGVTIAGKYEPFFPVGVAVAKSHLQSPAVSDIITTHFNRITAENAWKFGSVAPVEGKYNWAEADAIADFAREHNMKMTGHTLVWHRQAPMWLFTGLKAEDPASIEKLKARMKAHIDTIVPRYADVVDNWDVVNEAISDNGEKTYRDGSEGSHWYRIFGNEDYVYWAFEYARAALEAHAPGSSKGQLYYNDYNVNLKLDRILPLLAAVRERGGQVDGIGMQLHIRLDWPSIEELDGVMQTIIDAGYKVKVSELDVSLYNDYPDGKFKGAPGVEFDEALSKAQAQRYADLFALFRKHAEHLTSVTTWGVSDQSTWLDNEPVHGRKNHPLLFDEQHRPKAAAAAILDF